MKYSDQAFFIVTFLLFVPLVHGGRIDDFECHLDDTELETVWSWDQSGRGWEGEIHLDTTGGVGGSQSVQVISKAHDWDGAGGGWYCLYDMIFDEDPTDGVGADWTGYESISFQVKGDASNNVPGNYYAAHFRLIDIYGNMEEFVYTDMANTTWSDVITLTPQLADWENIWLIELASVGGMYDAVAYFDNITLNKGPEVLIGGCSPLVVYENSPVPDSYYIVLATQPGADVEITATPSNSEVDIGMGPGSPVTLTFTPVNWDMQQIIDVVAVDDEVSDGTTLCSITHISTSTSSLYNGLSIDQMEVNIFDDDVGVIISQNKSGIVEGEGSVDVYDIVLNSQPEADVEITATPSNSEVDMGMGPGSPVTLIFTPSNWDTTQTVNMTAVDDAIAEGTQFCSISHSILSGDILYDSLTLEDIMVAVRDNEPGSDWTVAVLRDSNITGLDLGLVDLLTTNLGSEGYLVTAIDANGLCSNHIFNINNFSCLILTYSPAFPLNAKDNFISFLEDGGDVVFMGGGFPDLDVAGNQIGINIFEDYEPYDMANITNITTCPNSIQTLYTENVSIGGNFEGVSAVPPIHANESKMIPLLLCEDRYGRNQGWACSLKVHYNSATTYYNSHWLVYGMKSSEFYYEPAFSSSLMDILDIMKNGNLSNVYWNEHNTLLSEEISFTIEPPTRTVRLTADGKHFEYSDGTPCFLVGLNYIGSFDRWFWNSNSFYVDYFEEDFKKAHEAGINWIRIYGGNQLYTVPKELEALKQCARKYGIYLSITVTDHTTYLTRADLFNRGSEVAEIFKNEPMVFGYDLQNEPYYWDLGIITDQGIRLDITYPHYSHGSYNMGAYENNWLEAYPLNSYGWHGSTFPGIDDSTVGGNFKDQLPSIGRLPVNHDYESVFNDVNGIYHDWASWLIEGVRSQDASSTVTVGYNTIYSLMPGNYQLDYIDQHIYRGNDINIESWQHEDVIENLTALDRIKLVWENKPIVIGEFGYSNGIPFGTDSYLDTDNSALGEIIHYLYAFVNGYDGVKKWQMHDLPLAMSRRMMPWISFDDKAKHIEQGRFGMFIYDGTKQGRPKPIVFALKFFRDYLDNYVSFNDRGNLEIYEGATDIKTVYKYENENALFIGNTIYDSNELSFNSQKPVNVMLIWDDDIIKIMSTSDVIVNIKPSGFVTSITSQNARTNQQCGSVEQENEHLIIELLKGYVLEIEKSNADLNSSHSVNIFDFALIATEWANDNSGPVGCTSPIGDVNGDCKVDIVDLTILSSQWLK